MSKETTIANKKSKRSLVLKIIFSIIFAFPCAFLLDSIVGFYIRLLVGYTIKTIIVVVFIGLFIWLFIKSSNVKKMWGRILMSVGLMLFIFPFSSYLQLVFLQSLEYGCHFYDIFGVASYSIITPVFVGISISILILGSGLLTGSYFLRNR